MPRHLEQSIMEKNLAQGALSPIKLALPMSEPLSRINCRDIASSMTELIAGVDL